MPAKLQVPFAFLDVMAVDILHQAKPKLLDKCPMKIPTNRRLAPKKAGITYFGSGVDSLPR